MKPKLIHKIAFSALVIVVLFFIAGFIYVYISDHNNKPVNNNPASVQKYQPIKPSPSPGPNAQVGVAEEAFDSPVAPGSTTSIIISTTAGATCTISVTINNKPFVSPSLKPQTADAYGSVTWSWPVPSNTPYGSWPVKVTCSLGKNWAVYDDFLVVKT